MVGRGEGVSVIPPVIQTSANIDNFQTVRHFSDNFCIDLKSSVFAI